MIFFDCHCHLSDERVFAQAPELIARAKQAGVSKFILAGTHPEEWERQLLLRQQFPQEVILNFGLHPWWVESFAEKDSASINRVLDLLREKIKLADGLGETGLDFASKRNPKFFAEQERVFRVQIQIALSVQKPIILHIVHAHEKAIQILKEEKASAVPLIVHSYSGNVTQLEEYLKLGAYISYSGSIVRETGYEKVKKSCERTPTDRILLETDSPDQGWGEEPHEPAQVPKVYAAAAKLLDIPQERLEQNIAENIQKIGYHRPS